MLISSSKNTSKSTTRSAKLNAMLRVEWLGQMLASVCWIISMLFYGLGSPGDWLQLTAASAWCLANIASIAVIKDD